MKHLVFFSMLFVLSILHQEHEANAIEAEIEKIDPETNIIVLFSSEDGSAGEHQRLLDMSLGHFSNNITFKNTKDVEPEDLNGKTHLFYYGETEEDLPSHIPELISSFDGPTVAIGYNVEQLGDTFSFVDIEGEETIKELEYLGDNDKTKQVDPQSILETTLDQDAEVFVQGDGDEGEHPLIMSQGDNYYVATNMLYEPYSVFFSQTLNTVFETEPTDQTPAYLRIEDVHPMVDPDELMAIADELKARDIPYMIAVIPVYLHPETGEEIHFDDMPEVLEALKYMQDNGGSVVLHGYTHQFRLSETGEGFEFWDVENDMPIYHGPNDNVEQLEEDDFDKQEDYVAYMADNKAFERAYVEDRLTRPEVCKNWRITAYIPLLSNRPTIQCPNMGLK
ncbi:DUF2334 domain-containing protein [Salicibibacter cibi]|uniref:DUF2334 domain-containing protein n=1 Tax=Salicibibacter cibi TaxID=2743001 RepID=A0A7T7CGV7_9BACI|nr:DUF2334 domain-containing protein [Salicibibacter cibi]QQK81434.1 DUF2334 domain-containing protein [Salicibibacter cibi]